MPWVAAFGLAGQITRPLASRFFTALPPLGYLLLTAAYVGLGVMMLASRSNTAALAGLLFLGGLGLGIGFTTLIGHLTNAVPVRYAPDISGVSTTVLQIGGAVGVAAFGSIYLALAAPAQHHGNHAFAITCLAMAAGTTLAIVAAHQATRPPGAHTPASDAAPTVTSHS